MANRLNAQSLFTGVNSGLSNTYNLLASQYSDGVSLENLSKSLTNTAITSTTYGTTFASYLKNNFSSFDQNGDGILTTDEIQNYMTTVATQGLTKEQITTLGSSCGMSSSLQETVLNHFEDIDTNNDGKVTNAEIQAYGINSDLEKQKIADINRVVNNMSLFYDTDTEYEGSLLDYKYLEDEES